jgi:hypothetical protein
MERLVVSTTSVSFLGSSSPHGSSTAGNHGGGAAGDDRLSDDNLIDTVRRTILARRRASLDIQLAKQKAFDDKLAEFIVKCDDTAECREVPAALPNESFDALVEGPRGSKS